MSVAISVINFINEMMSLRLEGIPPQDVFDHMIDRAETLGLPRADTIEVIARVGDKVPPRFCTRPKCKTCLAQRSH